MKTKYPNLFGILAVLMLVASFVVPVSLTSPSAVQADPGVCKWDTFREPGALPGSEVVALNTDPIDFAVGSDFNTVVAIVDEAAPTWPLGPATLIKWSGSKGQTWTSSKYSAIGREPLWGGAFMLGFPLDRATRQLYQVAMAPDNPNFYAVTTDGTVSAAGVGAMTGPRELWVTQNGGADWDFTNLAIALAAGETIRTVDISVDYGGKRDIAVGTTTGAGGGRLLVVKSTGFSGWQVQEDAALGAIDYFAVKFSPSYASDASLAVVFADATTADNVTCLLSGAGAGATFYNVQLRDIDQSNTLGWAFPTPGIEVKDASWVVGSSPSYNTLNKADLELPSDFSGQAASLRRAYISLDAMNFTQSTTPCGTFGDKMSCNRDGIFRMDDTTVYTLMDTSNIKDKSIYSIAYFGTYASGKLLAGERMGYPCSATVPTWFTDSPTTCPIPCWYPCLKCPTGAACQGCATVIAKNGIGAAIVAWAPQGNLAYVITGSKAYVAGASWWAPLVTTPVGNDESAMSVSRNNGETWNQISLIDTTVTQFTDIAPTPDCKTIYLASVNVCGTTTTTCSVSWSANVTCYGSDAAGRGTGPDSANCTIVTTSWPSAACGTITDNTSTSSCSWNPDTCECTFTFRLQGKLHCTCTTCETCKVDFDSGTVTTKVKSTDSPKWKIYTVTAPVNCSTQPGVLCAGTTTAAANCCFDSVWRTSANPDVVSPFSPVPGGVYWERVFTHVTAPDCTLAQTDKAILRLVPYCADPTGEIIAWAVYGGTWAHGVAAWSPDFGDYWAMLTPRNTVQDFCFESRTVMYFLSPGGLVQKMPYTGTAWSSALPTVDSTMAYGAHTIAAYPEGKVLVGANALMNSVLYSTGYSSNMNTDNPIFTIQALSGNTRQAGNIHVAFDPNFKDNGIYYIGDDSATGSVFRNKPTAQMRWSDTDMMAASNGAIGAMHPVGQFGIVLAFTGQALYSAHRSSGTPIPCGVDRTIDDGTGRYGPLSGMPKPGIAWDHLSAGFPAIAPCFTLEPSSLKICGCCTLDTDSTLYAIDNALYVPGSAGLIWAFTDCMAKRGPALVTDDKTLIGCDPVSGRSGEVNLCWEQLCVANEYEILIAKDAAFKIVVVWWTPVQPADVMSPCVYFPAGGRALDASAIGFFGNLECGHTYYWMVKVVRCATGQAILSPWSEVRSFNVKAGLPVVSSYTGLQLLSPANGSMGIPVKSPAFSWAPLGENTKYKFQLAKDGNMTQIVKEAEVTNTAYGYDGTLDYSTPYFWKVSCVDPACDSSATFSFQTEAKPAAAAEKAPVAPTPVWVWVVIAIGAILVIVTLVLIFKTRRV